MYPHLIEIHTKEKDSAVALNVGQIVSVVRSTIVTTAPMIIYEAKETYEEIMELIRNSGAHIEKGDPRLDLSRPLTIEDLRGMIGEPVWNSNTLRWELVCSFDDDGPGFITETGKFIYRDKDNLNAFPLYRMKEVKCS